jgi:hypothetical protein
MAERLGSSLRANLAGARPGGGSSLTRHLTASADAYRAYVRGEAFFQRGELAKATEEFRRATILDPEFALAHYRFSIAASGYLGGGNFMHATVRLVEAVGEGGLIPPFSATRKQREQFPPPSPGKRLFNDSYRNSSAWASLSASISESPMEKPRVDTNSHEQETATRSIPSLSPSTACEALPRMGRGIEGEGKITLEVARRTADFGDDHG